MRARDVLGYAEDKQVTMVDLKFLDLVGGWRHFTLPVAELREELFEEGLGLDGSSLRGWQPLQRGDLIVVPDPTTAVLDPFLREPTLSLLCNVLDPSSRAASACDPRAVAQRAERHLERSGYADEACFGPEASFFVFDRVEFNDAARAACYRVEIDDGPGRSPGMRGEDLHTEIGRVLEQVGIEVERQHHELPAGGHAEIDIRYDTLSRCADHLMWFKYVVKNVARAHGKTATFMPQPVFGTAGSGMHTHQSLWRAGHPLFAGDRWGGLSQLALHYLAGLLHHAPALAAFCNPTTNSYKRLAAPDAPRVLAYSSRSRAAVVRVPTYSGSPKAKRLELRTPDAAANPYLAFSAMLMAGLDGIAKRLDPGDPFDRDLTGVRPEQLRELAKMPATLEEALQALRRDRDFLLEGGVFNDELLETWIRLKTEHEIEPMRQRPSPHEFALYWDV